MTWHFRYIAYEIDKSEFDDMNLIEEYLDNISKMKLSYDDYGDKRKVRKSNKLADRNVKIAESINTLEELKKNL